MSKTVALLALVAALGAGCADSAGGNADAGADAAGCRCIEINTLALWVGWTCDVTEKISWGCEDRPEYVQLSSVSPACLGRLFAADPATGCVRPFVDRCTSDCPPTPRGCDFSLLGQPCTPAGKECGGDDAACALTSATSGICSCPCTPDDPTTWWDENSCPDPMQTLCRSLPQPDGTLAHICLRTCHPRLGANDCPAGSSCQPLAGARLDPPLLGADAWPRGSVCLLAGCQDDIDCPVLTSRTCTVADKGSGCAPDERCETVANSLTGRCAKAGRCDRASGLCAPREAHFLRSARAGDPCQSDLDCSANQRCEGERVEGTAVHARGGYCVIEGCAFASTLPEFACDPAHASCDLRVSGGRCLKTCTLDDALSCRNQAADRLGDYECRDLSAMWSSEWTQPICDFGDALPCAELPAGWSCEHFGGTTNPTGMACRGLDGKILADPRSLLGFCLDATSSGPPAP